MPVRIVAADTHVHIDAYRDREAVLDAARDAGVVPVIVSGRASEYRNLSALFGARDSEVRIGLGIHPEAAGSVYAQHEMAILRDSFGMTPWIAEVGLDAVIAKSVGSFFGSQPTLALQQELLDEILSLGVERKILSVHSRGAEAVLVDMLLAAGAGAVAFHWFRGDRTSAMRVANAGYCFSINVDMLRTTEGRELVAWLPPELLLFETDGPFTAVNGRPSEPRDVVGLASEIAGLRTESRERVLEQAMDNFIRLEARAAS